MIMQRIAWPVLAAGSLARSLLAASLLAACSSAATPHGQPPRSSGDPPPLAQSAPTERECDELITHAVALGIDERAARPERTTQADHEAVRSKLREDFVTGCRALPRDALACALAARTLSELAACQPSPSSSTSNSSVAPGGITPPAPRSP
jgi:hypothetical protein